MNLFDLAAKLRLDASGFEDGVKDAEKAGHGLAGKLEQAFNKVEKVAKAALSVAAIKKVGDAVWGLANDTAAAGDVIDKASQRLGMSRKAYQEWDYILGQSGASIESMGVSMKTMNTLIQSGSAEAKEAFSKLGLSMDFVASLPMENQFAYIINAFQQMPEGAEKSALAVKIFGRNGMDLLPLLNTTAEGMGELYQQIEDYGLIMGDDAVDASVAFGDALDALKRTFNAFKFALGARLLPTLTEFFKKVTGYMGKLKTVFTTEGMSGVFRTLAEDIRGAITWDNIRKIGSDIIEKIKEGFTYVNTTTKVVLSALLGLTDDKGQPLDGDVSWVEIGASIIGKIWEGLPKFNSEVKASLAEWLHLTDSSGNPLDGETSWTSIGVSIITSIFDGLSQWNDKTQAALAKWLGLVDDSGNPIAGEVTWTSIGQGILTKIRDGMGNLRTNLAKRLGLIDAAGNPVSGKVTWSDIGKKLMEEIKNGLKETAVSFSTMFGLTDDKGVVLDSWSGIGVSLANKLLENVESGGLINKLLEWGGQKLEVAAELVSQIFTAIGNWLGAEGNGQKLVDFISNALTTVINSLGDILTKIIPILVSVLSDPQIVNSLIGVVGTVVDTLTKLLADPKIWGSITSLLGTLIDGALEIILANPTIAAVVTAITSTKLANGLTHAATLFGAGSAPWAAALSKSLSAMSITVGALTLTVALASIFVSEQKNPGKGPISQLRKDMAELGTAGAGMAQQLGETYRTITGEAATIPDNGLPAAKNVSAEEWAKATKGDTRTKEEKRQAENIAKYGVIIGTTVTNAAKVLEDAGEILGITEDDEKESNRDRIKREYAGRGGAHSGKEAAAMLRGDLPSELGTLNSMLMRGDITNAEYREQAAALGQTTEQIESAISIFSYEIEESASNTTSASQTVSEAFSGLGAAASAAASALAAVSSINVGGESDDGQHAKGLWDVPYDDYIARLHRGERVLTASQARHMDDGDAGIAAQVASAVKEAVSELVGSMNITMGEKVVGKVFGNATSKQVRKNINFANAQTAFSHGR